MGALPIILTVVVLFVFCVAVVLARAAEREREEEDRRRVIDERLAAANGRPHVDRLVVEPAARRDD